MSLYLRRLPKIEYLAPKTIDEALSMQNENENCKFLAGGTDLLIQMKNREKRPSVLIGLKNIPELNFIEYDEANGLRIGALTLLQALANSSVIRDKYNALHNAVSNMASLQVRNLGTIGGNLCNAAPSADTAPPLLVLDAKLKVVDINGDRVVPAQDFFTGPGGTILTSSMLLTEIQIDWPAVFSSSIYLRNTTRNAMDLARASVAAFIKMDSEKGICEDARIALGAVAPVPMRADKAERLLKNTNVTPKLLDEVGLQACQECRPITDVRSTAEYRKEMIRILTRRAVKALSGNVGGKK